MHVATIHHSSFTIHTLYALLFKGRDEFLAKLRQHLTAEGPVVIKGNRTIRSMGGVGKARAAIRYAWKQAADYRADAFDQRHIPLMQACADVFSLLANTFTRVPQFHQK